MAATEKPVILKFKLFFSNLNESDEIMIRFKGKDDLKKKGCK